MNSSIIISSRVLETIKSLPEAERRPIANALSAELLLGADPDESLTSFQSMLYSVIRFYVKRDSERIRRDLSADTLDRIISV